MFEIELKGSYYEMGFQYGSHMKKVGFIPSEYQEELQARYNFADKCEIEIQKHTPNIINYLKGFAEGGDFDYDRIKTLPMVLMYGFPPTPSCTICYVASEYTSNGFPFIFRNYDWDYSLEKFMTLVRMNPTEGYASLSFSDIWAGAYGGINEKGLIVGITAAASYKGEWKPGISMNLLVQHMLNTYSNCSECAQFLKSVPHMGGFHFFIVDKDYNISRVLGTPENVIVEFFKNENTIQTNHFLIEEMKFMENQQMIPKSSPIRYNNVQKWLNTHKGKITSNKIKELCTTAIPKGGIHEDDEINGIKFGSIWSWYYDFEKNEFFVSNGNPKMNEYQKVSF